MQTPSQYPKMISQDTTGTPVTTPRSSSPAPEAVTDAAHMIGVRQIYGRNSYDNCQNYEENIENNKEDC